MKKAKKTKIKARKSRVIKVYSPKITKDKLKRAQPIGVITHYYSAIKVGIVKFKKTISTGTKILIKGATTNFSDTIKSMQFNHKEIKRAPKGKQIGIKLKKRVRVGDKVFLAE